MSWAEKQRLENGTMSIEKGNNETIPLRTEEYYERIASQEEEYLEEAVEKLRERELIVSEETANNRRQAEAFAQKEVDHAAEDLITGDSDDPPLSDETVAAMDTKTSNR